MSNTLLVDADVLCYQIAFSNQQDVDWDGDGEVDSYVNEPKALAQLKGIMEDLMETLDGSRLIIVLSDAKVNWRKELADFYKANRTKPKPLLWRFIRDHLEWGDHDHEVIQWPRLEGDDVLGILQTRGTYPNSVIVSIDKDMRTVPGRLYLWNEKDKDNGIIEINRREAALFHLRQVLEGDQVDNYKGCPGVGLVKALEAIAPYEEEPRLPLARLWHEIRGMYEHFNAIAKDTQERGKRTPGPQDLKTQARLAHILHDGDYDHETHKVRLWHPKRLRGL